MLIVIASVVLGAISGTLLGIDGAFNRLARNVEFKFRRNGGGISIAEGFVSATLLFCIGSMTVTGSIQSGLTGDHSILITKATLDFVSSMMLASSLGFGVLFVIGIRVCYSGGIVLLAGLISPFMTTGAINEMTCVGSLLIMMIGTNMMGITKIKVADFLPAIIYAPIIYNVVSWISNILHNYIKGRSPLQIAAFCYKSLKFLPFYDTINLSIVLENPLLIFVPGGFCRRWALRKELDFLRKAKIPLVVIIACMIMGLVDAVIQPGYVIKSFIKLVIFLMIPIFCAMGDKNIHLDKLFKPDKKGILIAMCLGLLVYGIILGAYCALKNVFDFSALTKV